MDEFNEKYPSLHIKADRYDMSGDFTLYARTMKSNQHEKIESVDGWNSKMIPRLLNTIYYEIIKEECWNFVKENKNPTINFKTLQHFVFAKVRDRLPNLF